MKKILFSVIATFQFVGVSSAYLYTPGGTWSSESSWARSTSDTSPVVVPDSNDIIANLYWSFTDINVDGDYTLSALSMNRDVGAAWSSKGLGDIARPTVNLSGTKPDGSDGSINFDIANNSGGYVIYGSNNGESVTTLNAYKNSNSTGVFHTYDWRMTFNGGQINITDSANTGTRTAYISISGDTAADWTGYTYVYDFSSAINSTENLTLKGWGGSDTSTGVFKMEFNNSVNLKNGDTYQKLALSDTKTKTGLMVSMAAGTTSNIGALEMGVNTSLVLDGTLNVNAKSSIASGAKFTINGVYKYSGSLTINGELEVNGILNAVSIDPYITVNSTGKLTVNSANKGDFYTYTGVRVSGGTLVINSDSFNASQKLWMLTPSNGATNVIELNSDASLYSFCWITDSKTQIIFDGESVLHLKNLSSNNGDYWSRALDETIGLELVNYKNGLIQVDRLTDNSWTDPDRTKNATDNLEYIVADGFEAGSMEWVWHDETSTYWLEGAAIPEPSVFAFLFGGFASVYILVRRTKKIR